MSFIYRINILLLFILTGCSKQLYNKPKLLNSIDVGKDNSSGQLVWFKKGKLLLPVESGFFTIDEAEEVSFMSIEDIVPYYDPYAFNFGMEIPVLFAYSSYYEVLNFFYNRDIVSWNAKHSPDIIMSDNNLPIGVDYFDLYEPGLLRAEISDGQLKIRNNDAQIVFTAADFHDVSFSLNQTDAYRVVLSGNKIFIVSNIEDLLMGKDHYTFIVQIFAVEGQFLVREFTFESKYKANDLFHPLHRDINSFTPFPFAHGDTMDFVIETGDGRFLLPFTPHSDKWTWSYYKDGEFTDANIPSMEPTRNPFTWAVSPDRKKLAYFNSTGDTLLIYQVRE